MAELFQITKTEKARPISEFSFQDELNDLEPLIRENPQLLGQSIKVFGEQVDTGAGEIIDLLALDKTAGTAQIVLIELKAGLAQQQVLLQTSRYARWIKNNPDSIRLLLKEKGLSTENVEISPKIIIVAPQIEPALLELSQNYRFEFDFVELRRYGTKESYYLLVDHKTMPRAPITRVRSREEWSWERYETELGISKDRIEIGKSLFSKIESIYKDKHWDIRPFFRQKYIPFKYGSRNVLTITYWAENQFCYLTFKLGQPAEELGLANPFPDIKQGFWKDYGEYFVRIERPDLDISGFIPFIEAAYRNVTKE
jgi:hypothetical protein